MAMFRRWAGTLFITCPPISTVPAVGESRPAMIRSNVDLPQPEGPTMVTISRSRTSNDTSLKARKSFAKVLDTLCNRMDDMTGIDDRLTPRRMAVQSLLAAAFRQRGRTGNCAGRQFKVGYWPTAASPAILLPFRMHSARISLCHRGR